MLALLVALPLLAASGEASFAVRALDSGAPLAATVEIWPGSRMPQTALHAPAEPPSGRLELPASPVPARVLGGSALLRVSARGYRPLLLRHEPGAASYSVWLAPEGGEKAFEAHPGRGMLELRGFVRRAADFAGLAGARLRLEPLGWETVSAGDGSYLLAGMLPPAPGESAVLELWLKPDPEAGWRRVEAAIPWAEGQVSRIVHDRERAHRPAHRLFALPEELAVHGIPPSASAKGVPQSLDDPPPSIRVGFADAACTQTCCGAGCAHVCVFDLESYVRRGITHEWIASWHPHALRAGTVAYRGYGAWRVANPIAAQYDICSSACCQVNGGTVHSSGASAVARTRGILLLRAGARFAAEYSAENNCLLGTLSCSNPDLSCGNGFNGSPSRGWPCLSDPVGLNRECFGHGRGMSQWGSQRWATHAATPRSWPWIVDHYYNAHGAGSGQRTAVMSRVLALEGAALLPPAVAPGQSFTIRLQARNRAAEPHERVLAGASIRRPGGPWISDPANDQALVLPSGLSQPERPFRVPAGTEAGSYEVALSLYLDIDEDGAIAGGDLPVASLTLPGALTVLALSPEVFSDGFESP